MSTSDCINVILCILSFVLATISVVTVIITLRQNNKMIENSTRPYISITGQYTNFQSPSFYLVLKNYGNSGATVTKLEFDIDISKYSFVDGIFPFTRMDNLYLAPNQCFTSVLNPRKMGDDHIESFNAIIEYTDGIHNYYQKCPFDFKSYSNIVSTRANTKGKELEIISYTLQDLVEKQF